MELKLKRTKIRSTYTIGELYIDDVYFCDTLQSGITTDTITGGTYYIGFSYFTSLDKIFPIIVNVPKFNFVAINYGGDYFLLNGNIIVGENSSDILINCESIWNSLMEKLKIANDSNEYITIIFS